MRMKSVSGVVFYVKDLEATAKFYETLGFIVITKDSDKLSVRLNWFWMDFHPQGKHGIPEFQKETNLDNKGAGEFLYISVDDVDEFHKEVIAKGLTPASEPQDYPWGNREFMLRDPDGYKLVFFRKLKKK